MASSPTDPVTHRFVAPDGVALAWHELAPAAGGGRPLVLIHGLFSSAEVNWIKYGHARRMAERGFRVVMPDLRAHGASDRPHDPAAYPPDILRDDALALIRHLGLSDYDLGGYSLGGRTVARLLVAGERPRRAVIAGMGLQGLTDTGARSEHFRRVLATPDAHPRGSPEWAAAAFLKSTGGDPLALLPLIGSFVDSDAAALAAIPTPTLVLTGIDDRDNGSTADLARLMPHATLVEVPGNHMSAVARPELGKAIADYLAA